MPTVDRPTDEPAPSSDRSAAARILKLAPEAYVLLCGLAHQIILRVNTFQLDYDHTCIMTTAVNFMRGGVLGSIQAPEYDLSVTLQGALSHWPPGFALTLVLLRLVIKSMYVAMVSADVISLTVFYAGCLFLMARLKGALTRPVRVLAAGTLSFVAPPYVEYFTNPWALGFYIWSVALLLPGENSEEPGLWACFVSGALAGGVVAFRLAYLPVCVVPVLAAVVLFWKRPGGRERVAALIAGWCVVMLPMLWWKFIYTGGGGTSATKFSDTLFFRSFYRFHPFATDALWGDRASRLFPESVHKFRLSVNPNQYAVRHIFAWIILAAAIVGAREAIRNARSEAARESLKRFFGMGAATTAFVVLFLSFMTMTHEPDRSIWSWVYVEEPRYYSPCLPFILLGAAQMVMVTKRGLAMAVLRDMSVIGFATAAVFWVHTIPGEWRAIQTGQVGGKIEEYFRDDGKHVELLRSLTVEDLPNVCVEIGYSNNATNIRMHETTFVGVPKAVIRPGGRLVSTRRINVMMIADPDQGQANADAFLRMCRANNGERMDGGGYYACRFVLEPTRRD